MALRASDKKQKKTESARNGHGGPRRGAGKKSWVDKHPPARRPRTDGNLRVPGCRGTKTSTFFRPFQAQMSLPDSNTPTDQGEVHLKKGKKQTKFF